MLIPNLGEITDSCQNSYEGNQPQVPFTLFAYITLILCIYVSTGTQNDCGQTCIDFGTLKTRVVVVTANQIVTKNIT